MMDKFGYAALHYLTLLAFLFSSWGYGHFLLRRFTRPPLPSIPASESTVSDGPFLHAYSAMVGIGMSICFLQWLAIAGQFRHAPVLGIVVAGALMGAVQLRALGPLAWPSWGKRWRAASWPLRGAGLIIALLLLPTLLAPLCPPLAWDEVMYHLPHAQQWVLHGKLTVNAWLRYPLFPYNIDVLFAGGMLMQDDVMPHMLNALMGWLATFLVYQTGKRHGGAGLACLATIIFLVLTRWDYDSAMIDLGVTAFMFAGCLGFVRWMEQPRQLGWLASAAFLFGVAVGAKYQSLTVLLPLAVALLLRTRKPGAWLVASFSLLLPCIYWYVRNYLMTGDPFAPVGGKLFGFTDWNPGDYAGQFIDLKMHADWPHFVLWPALLAPLVPGLRQLPVARAAMMLSAYAMVVWYLTSHYARYLMPYFPILALLAAAVWRWLFMAGLEKIGGLARSPAPVRIANIQRRAAATLAVLTLLALLPNVANKWAGNWALIAPTMAAREAILERKITGYPVLAYLRQHPMRQTYQFGLEDALYYAPLQTSGDHFGPGRYRDFATLTPAALAAALRERGNDSMLVHATRWPGITTQAGFDQSFALVYQDGPVALYRIL
ncbi:Dolichyl-phosphate-mannose-protein mannosyltransferase [Janthinobacterium sp. OK676]|uniref:ArnT family glycosyltransferase n=1 Tax=Janthinobacterium sp. OK676 TaxID=1855295 RepID=UPI000887FF0F|nr:glycosyltransferase family 39 protein [Janthinobacterium sp. OK676]SDO23210.1 Dolichyl-phosphate-mannose-protein mannosyltransferase [Janthinobacterium sp. OK676]